MGCGGASAETSVTNSQATPSRNPCDFPNSRLSSVWPLPADSPVDRRSSKNSPTAQARRSMEWNLWLCVWREIEDQRREGKHIQRPLASTLPGRCLCLCTNNTRQSHYSHFRPSHTVVKSVKPAEALQNAGTRLCKPHDFVLEQCHFGPPTRMLR